MRNDKPTVERISLAAILLRNSGYPDVAAFLMAKDKTTRKGTNKGKRVVFVGKEVRGKSQKFYVDTEMLDKQGG